MKDSSLYQRVTPDQGIPSSQTQNGKRTLASQAYLTLQPSNENTLIFTYKHRLKSLSVLLMAATVFFLLKLGMVEPMHSIGLTIVAIAAMCIGYTLYCLTFERTLRIEKRALNYTDQSLYGILNLRVTPKQIQAIYIDRLYRWLPAGWVVMVTINDGLTIPVTKRAIGLMTYKDAKQLKKQIKHNLEC